MALDFKCMRKAIRFTAIVERDGEGLVALCPELDVASQGTSVEEVRQNLAEAVSLLLETAEPVEIESRLCREASAFEGE